MRSGTRAVITTTCIGLAAAGVYMMAGNSSDMRRRSKRFRKNTGKALEQVISIMESASSMIR